MVCEIRLDAVVGAESTHDHVLHFGLLRFFQSHESASDLLHHQRVIVGELHHFILADQVNATVADVGNGKEIALDRDRDNRRTHARMVKILAPDSWIA